MVNQGKPIALHPENPSYFIFRGAPTILITSAEHYGAVMNLDFDYLLYLDELKSAGLNLTRTFIGPYRETSGAHGIEGNTLAPRPESYICPWPRSSEPGAADGLNRFDLDRWDEAYFARLKDFCRAASDRGIVVELTMFCPFYFDKLWQFSPLNGRNNVNRVEDVPYNRVYTLKNPLLFKYQEEMVRKVVRELNRFDNIIFEIMNEPWVTDIETQWQERIAETIADSERELPNKHLISWNVSNGYLTVEKPHRDVSVFNFHYASPPEAVRVNYHLNKPIGCNETGFIGQEDQTYRKQAWEFILAGGALFNNLDYSFAVGHERGDYVYPRHQPGGGSPELRKQLKILRDFIYSFDFIKMSPANHLLKGLHTQNGTGYLLARPGKAYALYVYRAMELVAYLDIPPGRYSVEWISPVTGNIEGKSVIEHGGGILKIVTPKPQPDMAVRILAVD